MMAASRTLYHQTAAGNVVWLGTAIDEVDKATAFCAATALFVASDIGNEATVTALVTAGADVHRRTRADTPGGALCVMIWTSSTMSTISQISRSKS